MTICEAHIKQVNNLSKVHISNACPFCLMDQSTKAESKLAKAREGLNSLIDCLELAATTLEEIE
jgi:hypothetical protein